jgi:predicted aspartyl protease
MSQVSLIKRIIALFFFAFTLSAMASTPGETTFKVDFKTAHSYMVIVQVSVNGAGPFNFLFDTGTSRSMIDRRVADQLSLPHVGEHVAVGINGDMHGSLVHSTSVSLGGATVRDLDLTVFPKNSTISENVSGILGEDFLERFNVLIDNRHHVIELEFGDGPLTETLDGERLPIRLVGMMQGSPTSGRLIVTGRAPELSGKDMTFLLDSGANSLVMFGGPESLGIGAVPEDYVVTSVSQASNSVAVYTKVVRQLRLGTRSVANLTAVAPPARPGMDTDGLMPTSAFHSIFISHSQKFVILDPSLKPIKQIP